MLGMMSLSAAVGAMVLPPAGLQLTTAYPTVDQPTACRIGTGAVACADSEPQDASGERPLPASSWYTMTPRTSGMRCCTTFFRRRDGSPAYSKRENITPSLIYTRCRCLGCAPAGGDCEPARLGMGGNACSGGGGVQRQGRAGEPGSAFLSASGLTGREIGVLGMKPMSDAVIFQSKTVTPITTAPWNTPNG